MYKGSKLVSNFKDGEELFIWSFEDIPHLDSTAITWDKHLQQASQTGKLRLDFQISVPSQSLINFKKSKKLGAPKFHDNDLKTDREDLRRSWKYEPSHHPFGGPSLGHQPANGAQRGRSCRRSNISVEAKATPSCRGDHPDLWGFP